MTHFDDFLQHIALGLPFFSIIHDWGTEISMLQTSRDDEVNWVELSFRRCNHMCWNHF